MNVKTVLFTDYTKILRNTNTIRKQVKEKNEYDTCNGNTYHHNAFRDELNARNDHRITQSCMFCNYFQI